MKDILTKRRLIMDCDTGSDDAVAIILAALSDRFDIVGICTSPLLPIEDTTKNTLKVLKLIDKDIPVYKGVECSLVKTLSPIRKSKLVFNQPIDIDGRTVRMHMPFDLPENNRKEEDIDAASFYVDYLRNTREKVTVMISGTCSNLALALDMDSSISDKIEEIVIMGGGYMISNISPAAESNFYRDPEAAQIVLNCGAKVTLMPLDATHEASFSQADMMRLKDIDNPISDFVYSILESRALVYYKTQPIKSDSGLLVPLHDALCIAYMIDPEIIKEFRSCRVDVECSEGIADGKMNVDSRFYHEKENVDLVLHIDRSAFVNLIIDMISNKGREYA